MFCRTENKSNVSHFTDEQGFLFLVKGKSFYLNDIEIGENLLKNFGPLSIFGFDKNIYIQDWDGNYLIYKMHKHEPEIGHGRSFFRITGEHLLGVENLENNDLYLSIINGSIAWKKKISLFNHQNYCYNNTIYLLTSNQDLVGIDKQTGISRWVFTISESKYNWYNLGNVYISERSIPIKAEIKKILGVYNQILYFILNSGAVLGLDVSTGEEKISIRLPSIYPARWSDEDLQIYTTDLLTDLDVEKGILFGLTNTYYGEMDLKDESKPYSVIDLGKSGSEIEELRSDCWKNEEIFFYQWSFAQDPSYVGIFNRDTREITWTSRELGDDGIFKGVKKIEFSEERLYVLDRAQTLHIFDRQNK